ncbi:hypothetical protein [Silvimonas amylolytica]|uniref:hypothetical protein n=1 Tax=Silvimonas amylolytica TaxID=449663 RepID=UPI001E2D9E6E|nr:hypothetical protein [Silvimonas amylolytica]
MQIQHNGQPVTRWPLFYLTQVKHLERLGDHQPIDHQQTALCTLSRMHHCSHSTDNPQMPAITSSHSAGSTPFRPIGQPAWRIIQSPDNGWTITEGGASLQSTRTNPMGQPSPPEPRQDHARTIAESLASQVQSMTSAQVQAVMRNELFVHHKEQSDRPVG